MNRSDQEQLEVFHLIDLGADADDVFQAALSFLQSQEEIEAATIYIQAPTNNTVLVKFGGFGVSLPPIDNDVGDTRFFSVGKVRYLPLENYYFFPSIHLGILNGGIAIKFTDDRRDHQYQLYIMLANSLGHVSENKALSNRLQHFIDRLHILNNLHQLIASNVSLSRIVRGVIHEAAFRFGADLGLLYVLSPENNMLELKGGYGCAASDVPATLSRYEGIASQVLNSSTHLASYCVKDQNDYQLPLPVNHQISGVDLGCLEVRGVPLGIIMLGFKNRSSLNPEELSRFEELSQMAAVAISNAQSQERIKAYTERLEELVRIRTQDLTVQTEKAQEANKAKSRFLANMSHELRTPLTAIVGYSSILIDGLFGELNNKQTEALEAITKSSQHLKNLIDDVLNLARIESGKEEPEPTNVPIGELVPHCLKLVQQQALDKSISLVLPDLSDELIRTSIFADQKHIHQALINLLSNAVKYTPNGGKVWVTVEKDANKIIIGVHDTGVGISAEKRDKLFERFERGDDAYSRQQEGTGIGLNLTKRLVQINSGNIWIESEVGCGSHFYISLPTATLEATRESITQRNEQNSTMRLDGLSGIVVDDNDTTGELLKLIIEGAGASVKIYNSAVALMQDVSFTKHPDFIMTDLSMPEVSGLELIRWIRQGEKFPKELPVIVLSACAYEEDRDNAADAGASFFLPKPFRPSEILTVIRSLTISATMKRQRNIKIAG